MLAARKQSTRSPRRSWVGVLTYDGAPNGDVAADRNFDDAGWLGCIPIR